MSANYYKPGSHNVICDLCGKKKKREEVRKTWNGFLACKDDWYPKPKNEILRTVHTDSRPVKNARPRHVNQPTSPGITMWTMPQLRWLDPLWRWDDDVSLNPVYVGGTYLTQLIAQEPNENGAD